MKTIFAIIGFVVVCVYGYHFLNSKAAKPVANTMWKMSAPYLNQAVNKAAESAKQAINK